MHQHPAPIGARRLALRACRLFETSDIDEARANISRVMQPHDLHLYRQARPARSHMDFLRLPGLGIGTIAFGAARIDVPPLDDYHLLIFCLSGSGSIRTERGTFAIDRSNGVTCVPGRPLAGTFSEDCEQFVVRIGRKRLAEFAGRPDSQLAPQFSLRAPRLRPWLAALRMLVTCPDTLRLVQDDPAAAADYEQLLLRLFLAAQDTAETQPASGPRPASVRRAIAYMEANAATAITLADIAAAAAVPERTLHDAFRQFEGTSPLRHLRNLRLDRVHAGLLAGETVTETALGAGFTHLGRFARDFAERFGQPPSAVRRDRL